MSIYVVLCILTIWVRSAGEYLHKIDCCGKSCIEDETGELGFESGLYFSSSTILYILNFFIPHG